MFHQRRFDCIFMVGRDRTWGSASTAVVITYACSLLINPLACAAATAPNSGGNTSPVNPRRGPKFIAACTRRFASPGEIRSSPRHNAAVDGTHNSCAIPRPSTSLINACSNTGNRRRNPSNRRATSNNPSRDTPARSTANNPSNAVFNASTATDAADSTPTGRTVETMNRP